MAAAQARAEAMMMRTLLADVIFSRINTSLFSAVIIVSLPFLNEFTEISLCRLFLAYNKIGTKEQNFQDVISVHES